MRTVLHQAINCAIDSAVISVADYPEEVRALEHLRAVIAARLAGHHLPMRIPELLHAVAILLGTFALASPPEVEPEALATEALATAAHHLRDLARAGSSPLHYLPSLHAA